MGKIYKGQTALNLITTVCVDINGAIEVLLKYKKPSGVTGSFTPTIITSADKGIIDWTPADENDLDEVGEWKFWAYVEFSDGKKAVGEPFSIKINEEGK